MGMPVWLDLVTLALIVVGALNWGLVGLFDFNLVKWVAARTFRALEPAVYILVGVAAIVHVFSRDFYLPFLGEAALPCGSLLERVPDGADATVAISARPGASVIYWAAESGNGVRASPWVAYQDFANAGVARADKAGKAVLRFRRPAAYKVPVRGRLRPHVHYRECASAGMAGRVQTVDL